MSKSWLLMLTRLKVMTYDGLHLRRLLQMHLPWLLLEHQTLQTLKSSWLQCTSGSTVQMPWSCATHERSWSCALNTLKMIAGSLTATTC